MFREGWAQLKCLLQRLMDGNDSSADSIVVAGLFAMVGLCALQWWAITIRGDTFNAMNFGIGAGTILGGMGGGVGARALMKGKVGKPTVPKEDDVL